MTHSDSKTINSQTTIREESIMALVVEPPVTAQMSENCISLKGINKFYGTGQARQQVLFNVSLDVEKGELLSIVGTSGSGKSTLLNIIGGLDRDYEGTVRVRQQDYAGLSDSKLATLRNHTIGFVFQAFNLLDHLTVWENVALPAYFDRRTSKELKARAEQVLDKVGLANKSDAKPSNLSGGQKQRVAIARALFNQPTILLCDEPTGNLDSKTGQQIIELFKGLNRKDGITLLLVTHERRVSDVAHRVLRIEDGRIVEEETIDHSHSGTYKILDGQKQDPESDASENGSTEPAGAQRATSGESES